MKSSRPYLLRGLYEWMLDNDATPHLMVDETLEGVQVPAGYGHEGILILSISPSAVRDLSMTNEDVSFSARFGGKPEHLWIPMAAVKGIFAKETGEGMQFVAEPGDPPGSPTESIEKPTDKTEGPTGRPIGRPPGRPGLKIVR